MHLEKCSTVLRFSNASLLCSRGSAWINPRYPVGRWRQPNVTWHCRQPQWCAEETADTSHMCTEAPVFFTSIGQIRFVKTLLRLTYEAVVNGNHISVIGHPIILLVQTHAVDRARLRRLPGTDRSCGSSESVAFQRVKAWNISHKCSLNSLSS